MATEVGIRELKGNLSSFLDRVEQGEVVTITKHGKPVARVVPPTISPGLAQLVADGKLRWSGQEPEFPEPTPLRGKGKTVTDYVREIRD